MPLPSQCELAFKARSHCNDNSNGNKILFFCQEWVTLDPMKVFTW